MALAQQLVWDYRAAPEQALSENDRLLCDYAVELTLGPGKMGQGNVDQLLKADFSSAQVTIATQVIGYFNYINRVADGLGVELDPEMDKMFGGISKADWLETKARF